MIRVIVVPVDGPARVEEIPDTLRAMQRLVGGPVERVDQGGGLNLWCNEEGQLVQLPFNRTVLTATGFRVSIHGQFFLARQTRDGELASVDDLDLEAWELLDQPEEQEEEERLARERDLWEEAQEAKGDAIRNGDDR